MEKKRIEEAAREIRRDVIRMTHSAGRQGAHIGGSLSLCEILAVLYNGVLRIDPENMTDPSRDRLILSKGHGAIAMYAALKGIGVLSEEDILTYKHDGSIITAHTSYLPEKGMEFASGSLGQGLSLGVGVALGLRMKGSSSKVYVILGDGECDEGSVWEAAASASHYGLSSITCIVDKNGLQYDGDTTEIKNMDSLSEKFRSFGWDAVDIDGHDINALTEAFSAVSDRPKAVICRTVKGKGVSFIENNYRWHNASLNDAQFQQALEEQEVTK